VLKSFFHLIPVITFILFIACRGQAFVNIESLRQSHQEGWYGSSGVTSGGSSGNINIFRLGLTSQNIYKTEVHEIIFSNRFDYTEAGRRRIANSGSSHLRYARRILPYLKWEAFSQVEFNQFQQLGLRTLNGGGLRWRLYSGSENSLYLGTGIYYEDEVVLNDEDQNNFRGNLYLSFRRLMTDLLEVTLTGYYQPSHKTFLDYRVRINLGLEFKVLESLTWVNEIRYMADTMPPQGIRNEDFFFNVGMTLRY
jgi:hypothetical protein